MPEQLNDQAVGATEADEAFVDAEFDEPESPCALVVAGDVVGEPDMPPGAGPITLRGWARFEAWLERIAFRNNFVRRLCSRIYLPLAFRSGLVMKKLDPNTFILPFRRFNKNWYDAMAGAALVANSEIAAGLYLFGELGGRWTIVCKELSYRFLRPCFGPAIYKVTPLEDLRSKLASGREFNIDMTLEILQQVKTKRGKQPRVGRCTVTFHCAPKGEHGNRWFRRRIESRLEA